MLPVLVETFHVSVCYDKENPCSCYGNSFALVSFSINLVTQLESQCITEHGTLWMALFSLLIFLYKNVLYNSQETALYPLSVKVSGFVFILSINCVAYPCSVLIMLFGFFLAPPFPQRLHIHTNSECTGSVFDCLFSWPMMIFYLSTEGPLQKIILEPLHIYCTKY